MVCSNWRGAIGRGAVLVLLCGAGLAWTQNSSERLVPADMERIMIVHDQGKATRCRVLESWKLPDGRLAHLLQSIDRNELITIVDDQAPNAEQASLLAKNPRGMPKRIFPWGRERRTPPEGSPLPPHMRLDSGVVVDHDALPPDDIQVASGPVIVNRSVDEKALGKSYGTHSEGPQRLEFQNPQCLQYDRGNATSQSSGGGTTAINQLPTLLKQSQLPALPLSYQTDASSQSSEAGGHPIPSAVAPQPTNLNLQGQGLQLIEGTSATSQDPSLPQPSAPASAQSGGGSPASSLPGPAYIGQVAEAPIAIPQNRPRLFEKLNPFASKNKANQEIIIVNGEPIPGLSRTLPIGSPSFEVVQGGRSDQPIPPASTPPPMEQKRLTRTDAPTSVNPSGNVSSTNDKQYLPAPVNPPLPAANVNPGSTLPARIDPGKGADGNTNKQLRPEDKSPKTVEGISLPHVDKLSPVTMNNQTVETPTPAANANPPAALAPVADDGSQPTMPTRSSFAESASNVDTTEKRQSNQPLLPNRWHPFAARANTPQGGFAKADTATPVYSNFDGNALNKFGQPDLPARTGPTLPAANGSTWRPGDRLLSLRQGNAKSIQTPTAVATGTQQPPAQPPVQAKPEPTPLVITNPPTNPKREMWGTALDQNFQLPGKLPLDKSPLEIAKNLPEVAPIPSAPPPQPVTPTAQRNDRLPPVAPADPSDRPMPVAPFNALPTAPTPLAMNAPEVVRLPPALPPVQRKGDPLSAPEWFNPGEDKFRPRSAPPEIRKPGETKPAELPKPALTSNPGAWPPGSQSTLAAKSGAPGPVIYVPVPTVTVPQPLTPPAPPIPNVPTAPQLNAYVNAFSSPPSPRPAAQNGPGPMMAPSPYMGYNPMMNQQALLASNPMLAQQMMAQQMMMQQMAMMQAATPSNPAMMNPYMLQNGMSNPMQAQSPGLNFARQYTGPQAPNPFAANAQAQNGFMQASYTPMQPQGNYQQPMMNPQYAVAAQAEQLFRMMRESAYPAQREWAAHSLMQFDWRSNPQIVQVLLHSATMDPAPNVRAGCIYCLGRMQAAVPPVFAALQSLRNDADPRVRQEVEQAFMRLGPANAVIRAKSE